MDLAQFTQVHSRDYKTGQHISLPELWKAEAGWRSFLTELVLPPPSAQARVCPASEQALFSGLCVSTLELSGGDTETRRRDGEA